MASSLSWLSYDTAERDRTLRLIEIFERVQLERLRRLHRLPRVWRRICPERHRREGPPIHENRLHDEAPAAVIAPLEERSVAGVTR